MPWPVASFGMLHRGELVGTTRGQYKHYSSTALKVKSGLTLSDQKAKNSLDVVSCGLQWLDVFSSIYVRFPVGLQVLSNFIKASKPKE